MSEKISLDSSVINNNLFILSDVLMEPFKQ